MTREAHIYFNLTEGQHFYDSLNDRYITVYSIYKDSKTALCTVEEFDEDGDLLERYNQSFTFKELARLESR